MEQRRISEADWKIWKRLRDQALERFCQEILTDAAKLKEGAGTAHERYLELYQLVKRRDKKLGEIFDNPRRSDAYFQIARALQARALTEQELNEFSEETQSVIAFLTGTAG